MLSSPFRLASAWIRSEFSWEELKTVIFLMPGTKQWNSGSSDCLGGSGHSPMAGLVGTQWPRRLRRMLAVVTRSLDRASQRTKSIRALSPRAAEATADGLQVLAPQESPLQFRQNQSMMKALFFLCHLAISYFLLKGSGAPCERTARRSAVHKIAAVFRGGFSWVSKWVSGAWICPMMPVFSGLSAWSRRKMSVKDFSQPLW